MDNFINELSDDYSYYRPVRPDRNSLYRALACCLLEHFCRPFTPIADIELFYRKLYYSDLNIVDDRYLDSFVVVLETLWKLMEVKKSKPKRGMWAVGVLLESEDFMQPFVQVLRCRAFQGLMDWKPVEAYSMGNDEYYLGILDLNEDTDDCDLYGLCYALDIIIVRKSINLQYYKDYCYTYKSPREGESKLVVNLARLDGNYYVLYPNGLEAIEGEEHGEYKELQSEGADKVYSEIAHKVPS